MFASIFTTHRTIFWKGKISFMKIKDGMKVGGKDAKPHFVVLSNIIHIKKIHLFEIKH